MKKNIQIPSYLQNQTGYKRIFSFYELYRTLVQVPTAVYQLIQNQRKQLVDPLFIERIQLAVTQVNECPACSYAHAYLALKAGMDNEEIQAFLSGSNDFILAEESKALLFAQHFAEKRGVPKRIAYEEVEREYGAKKAKILLAAMQVMLMGNIFGLPYSALHSRLKGHPYTNSSLAHELSRLIAFFLFLPIAILHALVLSILGRSASTFS